MTDTAPTTLKDNLLASHTWLRLVFMVVFGCLLQVAAFVMWGVAALQFVLTLFNGATNPRLREFSSSLCTYILQCVQFLCFNTDTKPYPFSDWPQPVNAEPAQVAE
jgi:hypothetical protein